jgi:type VI secretion system secreted protein VgrG
VSPTPATLDALPRPGHHQTYRLDIPQSRSCAQADVFSFEGERAIGEPTRYVIRFTHPRHDLARTEYLNKPATFIIQPPQPWSDPEPERRVLGVTTGFAWLSSNRDESSYEVVLESRMALLRNNPRCRFFVDRSDPEIIEQILRENGFDKLLADFEFALYRTYRKREFVMQWGEDDLAFITRLCRRSGLWYVCDEGRRCETVRFCDDLTHYRRDPKLDVVWQPFSGMQSNGVESVDSLEIHATTIATHYTVRTFNAESLLDKPVEGAYEIRDDPTTSGEAYIWGPPYLSADEASDEARLRGEASRAAQIEYRGTCDMLDLAPGSVLKLSNRELPDAKHGLLAVRVTCGASRARGYRVGFTAIPSDRFYRLPLLEETWPKVQGVVTGRIASTGGYKDPYIDEQGRYIVDLHLDRDPRTPGLNSCPMRLAKPFAGAGRTGFHFGLVEGTVVTVSFMWGNPDLPYISQVLHTAQDVDPIVVGGWSTRDTLRTRSNNTFEFENGSGKEHIKAATEHGKSQLNLGHTVDRDGNVRGEGFELRTDLKGHLRAGGGMLVSTDAQPKALGEQASMEAAMQQFESMQRYVESLAVSARASRIELSDLKDENRWLRDEVNGLKQSVIALSAPNGIGMATPDRVMVSAGRDVSVSTASWFNVNAAKRIAIAAGEMISLFASKLGIRIFSGHGPIEIQAQRNLLSLAADQNVTVSSVNGSVLMRAEKEFVIECQGAFLRFSNGCITFGAPNQLFWEIAKFEKTTPTQMHLGAPAFSPAMVPFQVSCEAWRGGASLAASTSPAAGAPLGGPVPAAPATDKASNTTRSRTIPVIPVDSPDSPDADRDPTQEPKLLPSSDLSVPVKLEKGVYCPWRMPSFVKECVDATETAHYMALDRNKQPWLNEVTKEQYPAGGIFPTAFELAYDEPSKCLYATVRVKIIPVDLFRSRATGAGLSDSGGQKQSVPYETKTHSGCVAYGVGKPFNGFVMEYRDATGPRFDPAKKKRQVEAVLNTHKSQLILDGCSKGASCGCRISVIFRVEFLVSARGADVGSGKTIHKTVHLFPREERADAAAWGEVGTRQLEDKTWLDSRDDNNVVAHECGHLFNFPDEYWYYGGWVHRMYILNNQLNFDAGNANSGKETWQISAPSNVMGEAAGQPVPTSQYAKPSACVHPYYLEYIRKHLSVITHKNWRVGYVER